MYPYITDFIFQTPTCRVRSGQVGLVGIGRELVGKGRERSGKVGVSYGGGPYYRRKMFGIGKTATQKHSMK